MSGAPKESGCGFVVEQEDALVEPSHSPYDVVDEQTARRSRRLISYTDSPLLVDIRARLDAEAVRQSAAGAGPSDARVLRMVALDPDANAEVHWSSTTGELRYDVATKASRRMNADALALDLMDDPALRHVQIEDLGPALRTQAAHLLLYPGRPVMISGFVRSQEALSNQNELILKSKTRHRTSISVRTRAPHGLTWTARLLEHNPLFAIGLLTDVGSAPSMRAAAILF